MKIFIILLLFSSIAFSNINKHIEYKGLVSFFGIVGKTTVDFTVINNKYELIVKSKTLGILNKYYNNKIETYKSNGYIHNNIYIPLKYEKTIKTNKYIKKYIYIINHLNKTITKEISINEKIEKSFFNHNTFKLETKINKNKIHKLININYKENDLLSLFLNLKKLKGKQTYIGQNDNDFLFIYNKSKIKVNKNNKEYSIFLKYVKDLFFELAETKNISFFGEAKIKRI